MNPRTLWACQPVAFMIWASVAPPFRWSRPRTVAFLLPSRAAAGLLPALPRFPLAALASLAFAAGLAFFPFFAAALALLAPFGAFVAVSAGLPPSRLWIAFQIRLTADFRSVNFFTGASPGMPFQTSISRSAGHSATRLANSCWLLKLSPSPASCLVANAVMLFSVSIVYVFICAFLCAAGLAVTTFITPVGGRSKSILRASERISGERLGARAGEQDRRGSGLAAAGF